MTNKGWKDLPTGGIITKPGSALDFKTGDWRSEKPIWNKEKCTSCLMCFIYCPDSSIQVKDGKMVGIDYDHCKGCGICAEECPVKVIKMEMERR